MSSEPRSSSARLLVGAAGLGVLLILIGVLVGAPSVSVEGAYFGRAGGGASFAGAFTSSKPGLLDPSDGNLWLGAGVALVALAVGGALVRRARSS